MINLLLQLKVRILYVLAGLLLAGSGVLAVFLSGATPTPLALIFCAASGLLAMTIPGLYVRHSITKPLHALRETVSHTCGDGDLSRKATAAGSGIAPAASAYNALIASFRGLVTHILFNATQVAAAAKHLMTDAQGTAEGSQRQHAAAQAAEQAIAEMSEGIAAVTQNAAQTQRTSADACEHSAHGARIANNAADEIERIAASVEQTAQVVVALGTRSEAISGIVSVIRGIADQTNLLALNAAIEAARAGEQGRGFAVVADEVRKLAERTTTATSEIGAMISAIASETQNAISSIEKGSALAKNGAELARQAAEELQKINLGAQETMGQIAAIAESVSEQNLRCRDIAGHVRSIMEAAERNSAGAQRTLSEAAQLDYLAVNLEEVGTTFKLGSSGAVAMKVHEKMPEIVKLAANDIGRQLEGALNRGEIKPDDLFDQNYLPIPNTKPQKYHTRYDAFADKILPQLQEPLLERHGEIAYAICCDTSGYVPTHNKRYSQPMTGDEKKDFVGNRTKRLFSDPVGKRCGAHELPVLLQTYRRDTGEIMHDISVPIQVNGRHWGGFRIGYRTE